MTKFFVIFNPAARGEKSRRLRDFLAAKRSATVTLAATARAGDAQQLASQAVADGFEVIVAAGGDGTINEVVNGIGTSGVRLGVLRVGTVNVFARELGIPRGLAAAWAIVERGRSRAIDLGCAETVAADGQRVRRYFVQLAGVGFDAWAVEQASWRLKKRIGSLSYVWAGLKAVARPCGPVEVKILDGETKTPAVAVAADGDPAYESRTEPTPGPSQEGNCGAGLPSSGGVGGGFRGSIRGQMGVGSPNGAPPTTIPAVRGAVVLIGNGRLYGGQFAVFPEARLDDGRLDVCVFAKGGYLDVLGYAQRVLRGVHTRSRSVICFQAERFVCRGVTGPVPFEVDGEIVGRAPVWFSVVPRGLRVVVA